MICHTTLFRGEIARFSLREGEELRLESGALWLTFGALDVVLRGDESFIAPENGEVMAQILGEIPARFWVSAGACVKLRAPQRFTLGRFPFWRAFHPLGRLGSG